MRSLNAPNSLRFSKLYLNNLIILNDAGMVELRIEELDRTSDLRETRIRICQTFAKRMLFHSFNTYALEPEKCSSFFAFPLRQPVTGNRTGHNELVILLPHPSTVRDSPGIGVPVCQIFSTRVVFLDLGALPEKRVDVT